MLKSSQYALFSGVKNVTLEDTTPVLADVVDVRAFEYIGIVISTTASEGHSQGAGSMEMYPCDAGGLNPTIETPLWTAVYTCTRDTEKITTIAFMIAPAAPAFKTPIDETWASHLDYFKLGVINSDNAEDLEINWIKFIMTPIRRGIKHV